MDVKAKNGRTPADPGEGLRMRSLGSGDFKRGRKMLTQIFLNVIDLPFIQRRLFKRPSIYDVRKIFGFFDPLPPLSAFD